jgi:2-polyprenyl-3-methyl-5-hydroxy-6-metoxy-1,4-benzoquinol methylase
LLRPDPSEQWERFGRDDPYYGVYAAGEFRNGELDSTGRERFFASGEAYITTLLADVRSLLDTDFKPERTLEYGCGVGRLLIPLARRSQHVVGVDVSPSMLAEAARNCNEFGVKDAELLGTDAMSRLEPNFDFVHTALVLQHVPTNEGERILSQLVRLLRPMGVAAIQVPIGAKRHLLAFNSLMKLPIAHNLLNVVRGRPWYYPHMQMNVYNLTRLLRVLRTHGVEFVYVRLSAASGGYEACHLIFRR